VTRLLRTTADDTGSRDRKVSLDHGDGLVDPELDQLASENHTKDEQRFAQQRAEIRRQVRDVERAAVAVSVAMAAPKTVSRDARHRLRRVLADLRKLLDELA
jgi:hypothetical protein